VRFRGDLTEKHEKLTQNTASVHVGLIAKGFYPSEQAYYEKQEGQAKTA